MQKLVLTCFGVVCVIAAFNSAFNSASTMLTTFAPVDVSAGFVEGESDAMERVRNRFSPSVFTAAGLLAMAGVWIIVSAWRQRPDTAR